MDNVCKHLKYPVKFFASCTKAEKKKKFSSDQSFGSFMFVGLSDTGTCQYILIILPQTLLNKGTPNTLKIN